ncbi:MAG: hypothetical protein C4589_11095 [Peptococcaceae bacterium]|nr:MAG: hypothetical protein C4589_11095 [Peptococcaceae bacterium]
MARVKRASYYKPKKFNQIGLCKYHNWLLSWRQVKNYGCLHKKREGDWCCYFRPNLKHEFWLTRDIPENIKRKLLSNRRGGEEAL